MIAESDPEARIALVSSSIADARAVMVEGESGILACTPPERAPIFEPSLKRLRFPNGAQALLYSASEPESLRGPQHSHACRAGPERILHKCCAKYARYAEPHDNFRVHQHPPLAPIEGDSWLITAVAEGDWANREDNIAIFLSGGWQFIQPVQGMRIFDGSKGQFTHFDGGWKIPAAPISPQGGSVIDVEARAAIYELINALQEGGNFPRS